MYIVTNTDQTVYIGQDYTNNTCDIKADGTKLFYRVSPAATDVIREATTQTATSGIDSVTNAPFHDYTVADSSIFRVGEILGWYASDGTTRQGSVRVESIPDATTVQVRIDENNATYTPASGDKLQYLADQFIPDGDSIVVKVFRTTTMLVKAAVANTAYNMVVTRLDSTVKKKN